MSYPASHLDLLQAPGTAMLSTLTPSGAIQTTAVWYLLDGDELKFSLNASRKKTQHLLANPVVNVFFLDPQNPFRTLEVRGTASLTLDDTFELRDKVGKQYSADVASFDEPGAVRYAAVITPTRVVANG